MNKSILKQLFAHLRWYEASEFCLMILMIISVPIYWHAGVLCLILLSINTFIKIILSKKICNPALSKTARICLILMILYFLSYVVSISYSNNTREAWSTIFTMLPLFIFPLLFLFSDMKYLNRQHFQVLLFSLPAALTLRFIALILRASVLSPIDQIIDSFTRLLIPTIAQVTSYIVGDNQFSNQLTSIISTSILQPIVQIYRSTSLTSLAHFSFDKLHHNYLSLYIITAIAFLYIETESNWSNSHWKTFRWVCIIDIFALASYLIISKSRSGLVVLAATIVLCIIHLSLIRKKWQLTCITIFSIAIIVGASYWISPKSYNRIQTTIKNISNGEEGDVRQSIWANCITISQKHLLLGYGCEGFWNELKDTHITENRPLRLNPHNQYLETILTSGIIGLLLLMAMIITPVITALKHSPRQFHIVFFSLIYSLCIIFESTLGRQMGLLFIPFWYGLLQIDTSENSTY